MKEFICTRCIIVHDQKEPMIIPKCSCCGDDLAMEEIKQPEIKKVDFDLVVDIAKSVKCNSCIPSFNLPQVHADELFAFFEMMARSSSFAHKAHKEIRKILE